MPSIKNRLARLEQMAISRGAFDPNCICFPENEQPFVGSQVELDIAAQVMCPLHGERFKNKVVPLYVSKWLRDKIWDHLRSQHSPQYCKAWFASFPPDLWPAEEILVEGKSRLRLKDGTLLPKVCRLTEGCDAKINEPLVQCKD